MKNLMISSFKKCLSAVKMFKMLCKKSWVLKSRNKYIIIIAFLFWKYILCSRTRLVVLGLGFMSLIRLRWQAWQLEGNKAEKIWQGYVFTHSPDIISCKTFRYLVFIYDFLNIWNDNVGEQITRHKTIYKRKFSPSRAPIDASYVLHYVFYNSLTSIF